MPLIDCAEVLKAVEKEWPARTQVFERESVYPTPSGQPLKYVLLSYQPTCSKVPPFEILVKWMMEEITGAEMKSRIESYLGAKHTVLEVPIVLIFDELPNTDDSLELLQTYLNDIQQSMGKAALEAFGDFLDTDSVAAVLPMVAELEHYPGGTFEKEGGYPSWPGTKSPAILMSLLIRWFPQPLS